MPYLPTPEEMADDLADLFGVYGSHDERCGCWGNESTPAPAELRDFLKMKPCRMCWNGVVAIRIMDTVNNKRRMALQLPEQADGYDHHATPLG